MTDLQSHRFLALMCLRMTPPVVTIPSRQPLIGIPFEENGQEVVRYFSEEAQVDQAVSAEATQTALQLAGAWSDLDWTQMERALERIRHDSPPTH